METVFHIGLSYQKDFPKELINELSNDLAADGLVVNSEAREIDIYMSMEWALPSIIIAYLSKPYFESFLKEAGKDHYHLLKKGFIHLFSKIFNKDQEVQHNKRSSLFSIMGQLDNGASVKFIFPEGLSEDEYEASLDQLLALLENHYSQFPSDNISNITAGLQTPSRSIYLEFSPTEQSWVLLDPQLEARKAREAQNKHNN